MSSDRQLFDYLLRLADSDLVLAQRLGEWVGHGPVLEEDIALTNVGLDLRGQADRGRWSRSESVRRRSTACSTSARLRNRTAGRACSSLLVSASAP